MMTITINVDNGCDNSISKRDNGWGVSRIHCGSRHAAYLPPSPRTRARARRLGPAAAPAAAAYIVRLHCCRLACNRGVPMAAGRAAAAARGWQFGCGEAWGV